MFSVGVWGETWPSLPLPPGLVILWKAAQYKKCFGLPGHWNPKEGGKAFVGQCLCILCTVSWQRKKGQRKGNDLPKVTQLF